MSEAQVHEAGDGQGVTGERGRGDVLDAAKPLPPDEDVLIDDLTDVEDRLFLAGIFDA